MATAVVASVCAGAAAFIFVADAVGFLSGATIVSLDADTVALTVDAVVPALATAVFADLHTGATLAALAVTLLLLEPL